MNTTYTNTQRRGQILGMISRLTCMMVFTCSPFLVKAQINYVPNGNFENNTSIPLRRSFVGDDKLQVCGTGWRSVSSQTSPDYFHYDNQKTCTTGGFVDVDSSVCTSGGTPRNNEFGEEKPSSGKAYAGIIIGMNLGVEPKTVRTSEYLFRTIAPLTAGKTYYISFKMSFAEGSFYAVNNIGAWVTNSTASGLPNTSLVQTGATPQLVESNTITKMNGWHTVTGTFQATASMDCIVIGYFPGGTTNVSSTYPWNTSRGQFCYKAGNYDDWAYYYIDDVRIYEGTCDCPYDDSAAVALNGDFSAPCSPTPTGYLSDLTYYDCSTPVAGIHPGIAETDSGIYWDIHWQVTDHTTGGGTNVLLVDGPLSSSGSKRAWYKTVNVIAGERYCFSAWVRNICNPAIGGCSNNPSFELRIGGLNGTKIDSKSAITYNNGWQLLTGWYIAMSTGPLEIDIVILGGGYSGNDGAIDDISFIRIPPIPSPLFTYSEPKCHELTKFTAAQGTEPYIHDWTFRYGAINYPATGFNPIVNLYQGNLNPGTVTVIHKVTYECGIVSDTQIIELPDCRPCCDTAIETYLNPLFAGSGGCCSDLILNRSHCDIYGVVTDSGGIPLQPHALSLPIKIGTFCASPGQKKKTKVHFLNQLGEDICTKNIDVSCDTAKANCCFSLQAFLLPVSSDGTNCACKFLIKAWQITQGTCNIFSVRLLRSGSEWGTLTSYILPAPLSLKQGLTVGELCIPFAMGTGGGGGGGSNIVSGTITVQFLDFSGNVICSQTLNWSCEVGTGIGGGGNGGGGGGISAPQQTGISDMQSNAFALSCIPNPFTKESNISYTLPAASEVTLSVFNLQGQLIETIDQGRKESGVQHIAFSNKTLAPGIYILSLDTPGGSQTMKILVTAD